MYRELVKNSMKINGGIIRISWDTNHPEMGLQFEESPLFDKGFPHSPSTTVTIPTFEVKWWLSGIFN